MRIHNQNNFEILIILSLLALLISVSSNNQRYVIIFNNNHSSPQPLPNHELHFAWIIKKYNKHVIKSHAEFSYTNNKIRRNNNHIKLVNTNKKSDNNTIHYFSIGDNFRGYVGEFDPEFVEILNQREEVAYVTKDDQVHVALENEDYVCYHEKINGETKEEFGTRIQENPPWNLDRIDQRNLPLDNIYESPVTGGRRVKVYVIDTGINTLNPDFEGRAVWGTTTRKDAPDFDDYGHGTHVAGVIAGRVYGVAKVATVIAVKALSRTGSGAWSDVIAAMDWIAVRHKSDKMQKTIVNLSLTGNYFLPANQAIKALTELGIHVVVAAGNYAKANACNFSPASAPEAITVGATNITDHIAQFSNGGSCVDVFAPGQNITSTWNKIEEMPVRIMSGTSMAAPHVAGVVALLISQYGNKSPAEMQQTVKDMATKGVLKNVAEYPKNTTNALLFVC
ncbi:10825_t:CDS:2 [Ambispora leptoticha]|uniref:10825_t:CDS:1 n=1 Tax=Ambispora leptoticha TaxID=144679 RepID=A0A9N9GH79_9GLOM|nr:10825_t:CDS:2 [Ambispora leptoticha]